jgi:hypothetical protein
MRMSQNKLSTKLISNTVLKYIHLIFHIVTKLTLFSLDQHSQYINDCKFSSTWKNFIFLSDTV